MAMDGLTPVVDIGGNGNGGRQHPDARQHGAFWTGYP